MEDRFDWGPLHPRVQAGQLFGSLGCYLRYIQYAWIAYIFQSPMKIDVLGIEAGAWCFHAFLVSINQLQGMNRNPVLLLMRLVGGIDQDLGP